MTVFVICIHIQCNTQKVKQKEGKHLVEVCLDALVASSDDHDWNEIKELLSQSETDINEPLGGVRDLRKISQIAHRNSRSQFANLQLE